MERWRQSAPSVHSSYLNYHLSWELELGTGTLARDGGARQGAGSRYGVKVHNMEMSCSAAAAACAGLAAGTTAGED